jgi:hypothetical protein
VDVNISTANTAQRQTTPSQRNTRGQNFGNRNNFSRGRGRGRGPPQQFSSYGSGSSQRPTCQVCQKQGYTATSCWYRFDQDYSADSAPLNANLAFANSAPDSQWYPDTGANVHLTNDLSNLNLQADNYTGPNQIRVGNGQGLKILDSGHGILPTPSTAFKLLSLFHVPQIQKNLISVNQFTRDNQVFIEFHPSYFCVKDLLSRKLLLQGPSKSGLYPWPTYHASSKSPVAFIGEKVSLDQWHL